MFVIYNYPKIVSVALPKMWLGQNLADLTSDYGPGTRESLSQVCKLSTIKNLKVTILAGT